MLFLASQALQQNTQRWLNKNPIAIFQSHHGKDVKILVNYYLKLKEESFLILLCHKLP